MSYIIKSYIAYRVYTPAGGYGIQTITGEYVDNSDPLNPVIVGIDDALSGKADKFISYQTVDMSVASNYTLQQSDNNRGKLLSKSSAITVTIPALQAGTQLIIRRTGAGQITFVADGTTLTTTKGNLTDPGQNFAMFISYRTGTDVFIDNGSAANEGAGDLVGPASSTNNVFPQFDGTTGKLLKNSIYSPSSFDAAGSASTAQSNAQTYSDGKVIDSIADGDTTHAPSRNSVFDALALKQNSIGYTPEDQANKSTNTSLGSSNTLYPTQNAVKTYVDNAVGGGGGGVPTTRTINGMDLTVNRTIKGSMSYRRTGRAWSNNAVVGGNATTQSLANGTMRAYPMIVTEPLSFNQLISEVTTPVASTNYRFAVYTDNGGYPDAIVAGTDAEEYSGSAAASVRTSASFSTITLAPGFYWLVFNANGAPTMRAWGGTAMPPMGIATAMGTAPASMGWSVSNSYGAMPSTFPGGGSLIASSGAPCPIVGFIAP